MERSLKMREEQVTKHLLKWLVSNGWEIICYDFPQSGTGRVLHPSNTSSPTEGAIIPDIIALKNKILVDFENKDRFVFNDFQKVDYLRSTNLYDESFAILLGKKQFDKIYFGIGMPLTKSNITKSKESISMADFILFVEPDGNITKLDSKNIF